MVGMILREGKGSIMDGILNNLQIYGDERMAVVLFAGILVLCVGIMGTAAMARVLGKRVLTALVLAVAAVVIVYRVAR